MKSVIHSRWEETYDDVRNYFSVKSELYSTIFLFI